MSKMEDMTFKVFRDCGTCKQVDFEDVPAFAEDILRCKKSGKKVKITDECEDWEFEKSLLGDVFFIKGIKKNSFIEQL